MRTRRTLCVAVATVVATSTYGCSGPRPPAAAPTRGSESPTVATSAPASAPEPAAPPRVAPARRADSAVAPEAPRVAVLPSGREVRVSAVGTTATGLLAVPRDVAVAGWWRGSSRLGDPFGAVLVAAHVDSTTQGLGPFAELLTVGPGARVVLEGARLRQVFEVDSRRLVPQGSLVDDPWIFDTAGSLRLRLVTCAPPFDAARGGYQNLAVVTALPVGRPERS